MDEDCISVTPQRALDKLPWSQRATSQNWTSVASSTDGTKLVAGALDDIFSSGIPRCTAMSADGQKLVIGTGIGVGGYLYTSSDARIWTKRF